MAPQDSHLASPKYGHDFVVSTTEESINAGLAQYLQNTKGKQPITSLFFLEDDNGDPTDQKTFNELLALSGGINPFDIPHDTNPNDPRIAKLNEIGFLAAVRIQPGIPPGLIESVPGRGPQLRLPRPIVTLGKSASTVFFNMYCSEVTVIKNNTTRKVKKWAWYSQQPGKPWYIQTLADISVSSLDPKLETDYFKAHPEEREALKARLNNISGTAFSLQQLLINLDSAVTTTTPKFEGVSDPGAEYILSFSFVRIWQTVVKERGMPILGITAVSHVADPSPLTLTGLERWVSPVIDPSTGTQIANPTPLQQSATTLNYLCAVDKHTLPGATTFGWNWVEPQDIGQSSGVISVKRDILGKYLVQQVVNQARNVCFKPEAVVEAVNVLGKLRFEAKFPANHNPSVNYQEGGPIVAFLSYTAQSRAGDQNGLNRGELHITSTYSAAVVFGSYDFATKKHTHDNTFTAVQSLVIHVYCQVQNEGRGANIVSKVLSDQYQISVDDHGTLMSSLIPGKSTSTDSRSDDDKNAFSGGFWGLGQVLDVIRNGGNGFLNTSLQPIPFRNLQNFVFPGGKVFTYKSAAFSKNYDLTALITYINPTDKQLSGGNMMDTEPVPPPQQVIDLDHVPPMAAWVLGLMEKAQEPVELPEEQIPSKNDKELAEDSVTASAALINGTTTKEHENEGTSVSPKVLHENGHGQPYDAQVQLSSSTDMLLNYVQGELLKPHGKFRALQTLDGNALLFAVDTSGALNVIEETTGQTQTGWKVTDLSSRTIKEGFASRARAVNLFDVGQSVIDGGTIGLAMSVHANDSTDDVLYLSLLNSPTKATQWISNPRWKAYSFDAHDKPSSVQITNIYFSETDQGEQYIMVDVLRDPRSSLKDTARYIVNPFSKTGNFWTPHKLPFDIERGSYQSCIGRVTNAFVDGIYTAGLVSGVGQLSYVPLFNLMGDAAPMPTRLLLPGKVAASAIASTRNDHAPSDKYGTTDLYAVAQSTLYRWDPDEQLEDNATGNALLTNPLFAGTTTLIALTRNKVTTIFGKNSSNIVYYTSCPVDRLATPNSWSSPVPVLTGVEDITSYINLRDGGNTIYAAGGNKIQQLTQATNTPSKMWQAQAVTLDASTTKTPALSFNSYTSTIRATGRDGLPVTSSSLSLTTTERTPVYIDGLYYVLSDIPVTVRTGHAGEVTIIQATESIVGAAITAQIGTSSIVVDPMKKSLDKLSKLGDPSTLRQANIQTNVQGGGSSGTATTTRLVPPSASDGDIQAVSNGIKRLTEAYGERKNPFQFHLSPPSSVNPPGRDAGVEEEYSMPLFPDDSGMFSNFTGGVSIAAGDLYNWLKTGVDKAVNFIKNVATGFWEIVVRIGGQMYQAVLDTVHAIAGAFEWLFDKVGTALKSLIRYLEFLFDWNDIRRTKQIMHNMIKYYMQHMTSSIKTAQHSFNQSISEAQAVVSGWANGKDWTSLGDASSKSPRSQTVDPAKGHSSGSQMLSSHFKNQAGNITMPSGMPEGGLVQGLIDSLINAVVSQGQVLQGTLEQLTALAMESSSLSLADILKRLAGILAETILGSTRVVVDALLNVLYQVASTALEVLDTKIHIPIISDILNAIGVPSISFLDLFTWIGGAGFTLIYKATNNKAPFPDDEVSRSLIQAKDWVSLSAVLRPRESLNATSIVGTETSPDHSDFAGPNLSKQASAAVYTAGHAISGFITYTGNGVFFAEAMDSSPLNAFGVPSTVLAVIAALASGGADALVAKMPIENTAVSIVRTVTTVTTVTSMLVFSGVGQKYLATGKLKFLKADDNRKVGAIVNSILVLPALVCTCYHFHELSQKPESKERSSAIMGETGAMMLYIGRISYCAALLDPEPTSRAITAGVMSATNVVFSGLEIACASI